MRSGNRLIELYPVSKEEETNRESYLSLKRKEEEVNKNLSGKEYNYIILFRIKRSYREKQPRGLFRYEKYNYCSGTLRTYLKTVFTSHSLSLLFYFFLSRHPTLKLINQNSLTTHNQRNSKNISLGASQNSSKYKQFKTLAICRRSFSLSLSSSLKH